MDVNGKVVEVEMNAQIEGQKGVYNGARLSYRDKDNKLVEKTFHENALKYNAALKNGLSQLEKGDNFVAKQEKKDGYWNWTSVAKGQELTAAKVESKAPASGGNWETAEERKNKQVYIVRQSSITAALNLLSQQGVKKPTVADVCQMAEELKEYVFNGVISTRIEDMEDDIPF